MMRDDLLKGWTPYQPNLARLYEERGYWKNEMFIQVFDFMAERFPDNEALVGGDQRFTYKQLKEGSKRLALHFLDMGLRKGDRIVVQLTNIPEFMFVYFAVQRIGVIPVMCLPQHRYTEVSQIATTAGAIGYITPREARGFDYKDLVNEVADLLHMKYKMIAGKGQEVPEGFISINDLLATPAKDEGNDDYLRQFLPDPHDVCIMLLSGGTTGTPKLIPREYNAYRYVAEESSRELGYNMYTVQLAVAPVAHNMVLAAPGVQGAYLFGGKVIMSTSPKPADICRLIQEEKITHIPMVPAMIIKMLAFEERTNYDLSSWEIVINGASKLEPALMARVEKEIGCKVISQFGMSEGNITQTSLFDTPEVIFTTIGMPVAPGEEWKIIDTDDGHVIAQSVLGGDRTEWVGEPDKPGEIVFRGPYTIRGYFNAPERNKEAFTEDGYYRSGDIACMHHSGKGFVIMGRIKDAINRGGEKFSCEEVENAVFEAFPGTIKNCALVGMPDAVLGEKACLYVQMMNADATLTLEEVVAAVETKLAKFKLPERIEIREHLPETNVGKIDKKALKAEIAAILKEEQGK